MNGGIHAREWISSHTATFIITSLLTQYGKNKEITYLLDNIEFIIAPHINPDGYEFSRTQDRMVKISIYYYRLII
jgi:extracellular matrix protein 14